MDLIASWQRWRYRRRLLKEPSAYETADGEIVVPYRQPGRIDWRARREEYSVADGEKLYGGFDTLFPEVHVAPHYQRRRPGTPVWVDGRQLDRRLYLGPGGDEIVRLDELLADWVENNERLTVDDMAFWLSCGASVYDRDQLFGDEELALNLLCDATDEDTALRHYEDFTAEVVRELPHARLAPVYSIRDAPEGSKPFARWFLPESAITGWLEGRAL